MGRILYWECNSGISGDMAVASLLDLGADEEILRRVLKSLPVSGFEVKISRVKKSGLDVCDFNVVLDKAHENHDHDMEYLHGHAHDGDTTATHIHSHSDSDAAAHIYHDIDNDKNDIYLHEHRNLSDILHIIEHADTSANVKNIASNIFRILAQAEAKAHGTDIDRVHFHEVGAVDSIADIVAVAVCVDNLGITDVIIPYLCEGRGTVRCQHGILPIPVPAVANIVSANNLSMRMTDVEGELVTPTGAAICAALKTRDTLPDTFVIKKIGMGAGKRNYERPSILRAMLIEESGKEPDDLTKNASENKDSIYKLETNIDDCTGEMLGYVMERLFENGARDVYYTPVFMKKNRPAYMLTVLCDGQHVSRMEEIIFCETTTIGIRRVKMERTVLSREEKIISTNIGQMRVKRVTLPDGTVRDYPEYDSVAALAKENNLPLSDCYRKK